MALQTMGTYQAKPDLNAIQAYPVGTSQTQHRSGWLKGIGDGLSSGLAGFFNKTLGKVKLPEVKTQSSVGLSSELMMYGVVIFVLIMLMKR